MKKEEILAICIEEIRSGKSTIEACVTRYPDLGKELRSLLEIATCLKPDEVTPSREFKQRAKRRLFEEMQPAPAKVSPGLWSWPKLAPVRVLASVLIGLLVLGVAGGSTVYAAQSSLPGDTLYTVKTGVENLQLAITPGVVAKANLHLKLVQRRIEEATQQTKLNRDVNVHALDTVEQRFDDAIKELSRSDDKEATDNVLSRLSATTLDQQLELEQVLANAPEASKPALKHAFEITQRGNLVAQVAYANRDFLKRQPTVSDEKLEAGQFKIDGIVLSIQGRTWNVGAVIIENVYCPREAPPIGSRVKLEGLVKGNEVFISRIKVSENSEEPTKVEGQFGGTNENGTANIGGISVKIGDYSSAQLESGDKVQLQGNPDDGKLNVTSKESQRPEASPSTRLSGVLTGVNINGDTITVKMDGSQITVNVSEARIENESGQTLRLSDLNRLVGQDIRLDGLYKRGNLLFARQLRVEAGE
jgi:hypothetical protein